MLFKVVGTLLDVCVKNGMGQATAQLVNSSRCVRDERIQTVEGINLELFSSCGTTRHDNTTKATVW